MNSEVLCKACGSSNAHVIESRICDNGTRRRRYSCLSCSYRWTYWDGPRPIKGRVTGNRNIGPKRGCRTTEEEVKRILLAPLDTTNVELAREMDFSAEWVRRIRVGLSCANVCPELERLRSVPNGAEGRSCYNCLYWSPGCDFGFPDPCKEGPGYAQDCDLFKLKGA
jgi:hypothetical protein